MRRAVRTRGHFPNDEAATKLLFLVLRNAAAKWKVAPKEWGCKNPIRDSLRREVLRELINLVPHKISDSLQARHDLSVYLRSKDLVGGVTRLPEGALELFRRVFGSRYFSIRCAARSSIFSIAATTALIFSSILERPSVHGLSDRAVDIALLFWALWALIPDYLNLLKTRQMLEFLVARQIRGTFTLLSITFVDLVIGFLVFTLGIFLISMVIREPLSERLADVLDALRDVPRFTYPAANVFWAGMMPSLWLWVYVLAAQITKLISRTTSLFHFLTYFLDIDAHPMRSVGVVAAILLSGFYATYLAASALL